MVYFCVKETVVVAISNYGTTHMMLALVVGPIHVALSVYFNRGFLPWWCLFTQTNEPDWPLSHRVRAEDSINSTEDSLHSMRPDPNHSLWVGPHSAPIGYHTSPFTGWLPAMHSNCWDPLPFLWHAMCMYSVHMQSVALVLTQFRHGLMGPQHSLCLCRQQLDGTRAPHIRISFIQCILSTVYM